jgi:glycosyltransferase involved in cell wall biosynthesis
MIKNQPFFSAIIPTYNRSDQLYFCLRAFSHLDYPRDRFEVIVVDDESEESLEPTVASFRDLLDIRLINQSHGGPAKARNYGAAQAKGEFLVFTDDDCLPSPRWLQVLAAHFNGIPHQIIGGRTVNALPHNPFSTTSQLIIDFVYHYYDSNPGRILQFYASNNMALPADLFHTLGGFDSTFRTSEDRDLCDRWLNLGYSMAYYPEAIVYHANHLTFTRFYRQHWGYGSGAFRFHQKRAQRGGGKNKLDLKFYFKLFCSPFKQSFSWRSMWLMALLILSQIFYVVGFIQEMARPDDTADILVDNKFF